MIARQSSGRAPCLCGPGHNDGARLASGGSPAIPWRHHAIPLRVRGLAMIKTHEREKLINAIVFFAANTEHCGKIKPLYLSFRRCSRSNMKT